MHCITDPLEHASSQARHHNVTPAHWLPRYAFNCTFNGGHGLAWVDGHLLCNHGMPLYAHNVGPGPIPLVAGHPVSVRLQFVKNTTDAADVAVRRRGAAHHRCNTAAQSQPTGVRPSSRESALVRLSVGSGNAHGRPSARAVQHDSGVGVVVPAQPPGRHASA
jgi:hypothetical protein